MMRFGRMILIVLSIALFSGLGNVRAAESSALPAGIKRPRQLFLTDLLARERGNWRFETAVGERITHPGTVSLTSRETPNAAISQLALLLDDPEFPNDDTRAVWKTIQPEADGSFLVEDPGFSMKATFEDAPGKTLRGTLSQIHLNGAAQSSGVLSGIFAWDGSRWITLLPGTPDAPRIESAVFSIRSSVSIVAFPSSTSRISWFSCPRPIRHGTHFPHVCAWHSSKNARAISTGQSPGGLDSIRRSRSL